jgi:lysozyme family protein
MQQNYDVFIRRVISRYEGGYCWDAGDSGGPTKFGITCWDLAEYMGRKMQSMGAWAPIVRSMSLATAEDIYAHKYARKDRFNDLEGGSDCVILDYGINSGVLRPVWIAQRITGRPRSNVFDDNLVKAINDYHADRFVDRMCDERMAFLRGLSIWPRFRGGWSTRVADLRQYCHHISSDLPPPPANDVISDRVPTIKTAQREYNEYYHLQPPLDIDGFEGPKTKAVTRRFQQETGLEVDGIVGEHTMAKLAELCPPTPGVLTLFEDEAPATMAKGVENVSDIHLEYSHHT